MEEQQWFLREHTDGMSIVLKYIPTEENTADILTKSLPAAAFDKLMGIMFPDYKDLKTNQQKRRMIENLKNEKKEN